MKGIWYAEDYDEQYGPIKMVTMFDGLNVVNALSMPNIMLFEASCVTSIEELQKGISIIMPSVEVKNKVFALAKNICNQIGEQSQYTKAMIEKSSSVTQ